MPFDEDSSDDSIPAKNSGLKRVSTQKSIFDNLPKKPSPEEFEKRVHETQERMSGYKLSGAVLSKQFHKMLGDKTLKQNKTPFAADAEKELLSKMVQLAIDINNDPIEQEGMGSLSWITLLLKICFFQRDRINQLEYLVELLDKRTSPDNMKKIVAEAIAATQVK